MPTYQYACTACGERLEAVQTFTDAPLTECRVCGGQLRKVFSAVGVVFKGSGFYKTDSRSAPKSGSSTSSGDAGSSSSSTAGTSDSTPASTPAGAPAAASTTSSSPASKTA